MQRGYAIMDTHGFRLPADNSERAGNESMEKNYNYVRVYKEVKEKILDGTYGFHDKLPTEAEFEELYGVSRITIKKAMEMLGEENLIERFPGKGTFVRWQRPQTDAQDASVQTRRIGVVMSGFSSSFGQDFLTGVAEEANRQGCGLMVGLNYSTLEEETMLIQRLIDNGVDGIIAMAMHSEIGINAGIVNSAMNGFPLVLADRYLEGISLPYVGSCHSDAAYVATQYLFELGHKCIGLISSAPTTTAITERESGYMKSYAMTKYPVLPRFLYPDIKSSMPGHQTQENIRRDVESMKRYYTDNPDVTALLCVDYNIMKICKTAAHELGLRIPEDMSLVCFDAPNDGFAQNEYTHIRQAEREIGVRSVKMLMDAIQGDREPKYVLVPAELRIGMSTGKPKA